ncbi:hypothetical protein ACFYQA_27470 [Streptomyces sp. NPDC005774]|uniref:DUF7417 domain-containing protein n=1 Tax=Streptomyces sp. NPDC005774 TaxID=3364728 RepID=UPI0036770B9E
MGRMKDIAIDLITYEEGQLGDSETLDLFSILVRSGMAWTLQGSYGRTASELIHAGYLTHDGEITPFGEDILAELAA